MAIYKNTPPVVTNGLVLCLDAANRNSCTSGSLRAYNLVNLPQSGSLTNGAIFDSGFGGSILFDGVDDNINYGNPTNLQTFSEITLSTWVYFTGLDYINNLGSLNTFVGKGLPDTAPGIPSAGFWFSYDNRNNQNRFSYTCFGNTAGGYGGGGNSFNSKTYVFSNNQWYNITATVSSLPQGILYINGIQQGAPVAFNNLNLSNNTSTTTIGREASGGYPFKGNMAITTIYNRALTTSEVLQNYNATKTRFNLT